MRFILTLSLITTALGVVPVFFDRDKVFRVKPQDEKQANIIKDLAKTNELDFWYPDATHHVAANMTVDFRISEKESKSVQSVLDQNKMHYEILIHDLQEEIEKQFDVEEDISGRHSYAKYNNWDKIVAWTEKMVNKCPEMVSRIKIGSTVEDNPLYVLKIGKDERRKAIFMDCGIHAREWISPAFCQWFVYQATKSYGKNKIMTKLLDRMNFYVLPVFNVDGYIWSWTQNRMWRKNRSKNKNSSCIGTDLNRNFDVSWNSSPGTNNPCSDIYRGPAPESEKETKAVTDFIRRHLKSIKAYITFHSYSQMLLFPYGYTTKLPPNYEDLNKVAKIGTDVISTRYETRYIYGPIASKIYPTTGSSLDWAYDLGIKHTFAFELRDKGKFGFLLPESLIKPTCKETMLAVKFIAKYILKHTS
ncbi:Mast cell carboxypeptidase A [Heterocephalus glaber]|uniref:Mast cell carboxypeptidase A n=1 Tax=Heterocephalus glaber TaxID=10181 RepID=G5BSK4_HETGA|nr:mast cell carboxypeptidase A [Heterocephalus glaber]EHB12265.1 Mast cell carboxypeptidase A [Heterocephalus glaber]